MVHGRSGRSRGYASMRDVDMTIDLPPKSMPPSEHPIAYTRNISQTSSKRNRNGKIIKNGNGNGKRSNGKMYKHDTSSIKGDHIMNHYLDMDHDVPLFNQYGNLGSHPLPFVTHKKDVFSHLIDEYKKGTRYA